MSSSPSVEQSSQGLKLFITSGDECTFQSLSKQLVSALKLLKPHSAVLNKTFRMVGDTFVPIRTNRCKSRTTGDFLNEFLEAETKFVVVQFPKINFLQFSSFIKHICNDKDLLWSFENSNVDPFTSFLNLFQERPPPRSEPLNVVSFAVGNMVQTNHFVSRYRSASSEGGAGGISDFSVSFLQRAKLIELCYSIDYESEKKANPVVRMCKLTFEFASIEDIYFSLVDNYLEVYFFYSQAPKVYVKAGRSWDRWSPYEILPPRDLIGKSRCLRLKVSVESESKLPAIISLIFSVFGPVICQIYFATIVKHWIHEPEEKSIDDPSFHPLVRRSLKCLNSLTNIFKDDLAVSKREDKFKRLINDCVGAGKVSCIVTVIYKLLNWFYIDLQAINFEDFYTSLKLVIQLGFKTRVNIAFQTYKILFTPLNTIYLPPEPNSDEDENDKFQTGTIHYIRDDFDFSRFGKQDSDANVYEPYYLRIKKTVKCANFFRKVIEEMYTRENESITYQKMAIDKNYFDNLFKDGLLVYDASDDQHEKKDAELNKRQRR